SDLCSNVFGAEPMNSSFSVGKNTSMSKAPPVRRWQKVQWLPLSVARRSAIGCNQIVGRWELIGSYSILITEHIATNHLILLAPPKRFETLTPRFVVRFCRPTLNDTVRHGPKRTPDFVLFCHASVKPSDSRRR